jgi:hypothetical protein
MVMLLLGAFLLGLANFESGKGKLGKETEEMERL